MHGKLGLVEHKIEHKRWDKECCMYALDNNQNFKTLMHSFKHF